MTRSYRDPDSDRPTGEKAGIQDKLNSLSRYGDEEQLAIQPVKPEFGKRFVAFMIDVFAGYLIGLVVNMIPFVNSFVSGNTVLIFFLIIRDGLFDGRGVGKNLMGLQVVDLKNGEGAGLGESFKRNIVIFGPSLVYFLVTGVLKFIPIPEVTGVIINVVNWICGIYTLIVLPYEAYRAMNRDDGMRIGDAIAGTGIIDAPMDFSQPLKR